MLVLFFSDSIDEVKNHITVVLLEACYMHHPAQPAAKTEHVVRLHRGNNYQPIKILNSSMLKITVS